MTPPPSIPREDPFAMLALPELSLEVVRDSTPAQPSGFLRLVRQLLSVRMAGGPVGQAFEYDSVERARLDAVVIAAHFMRDGTRFVYLRSALRPPIALRGPQRICVGGSSAAHGLWELAAGLVEPEEESESGVVETARRELEEELGFSVPSSSLLPLGPSTFPCPGALGERHYFFQVEVDPRERREPTLDGSVIEQIGLVREMPLALALQACSRGLLEDAKTELGLRRLAEALA